MPDYTILLIDYDPRSIERTSDLLVGAGYSVEVAKNGIEGLAAFKRLNPGLVLVEAMLPKKHGFEVCQEIKQSPEGANVPVVIFTAVYKGRKYRSQAFHLYKCDEYLEKPVPDATLLEAVGKLLPVDAKPKSAPVEQAAPPKPPVPAKTSTVAAAAQAPPVAKPAAVAATSTATAGRPATVGASAPPTAPRTEPTAAKPTPPAAPRPRRPRRDEPIAQFTEDDIMSTLDAIMPDEPVPDKTATN